MKTKPQVLVIDDDAVVGHSFDRVLSGKGYDVDTALTGEEALEFTGGFNHGTVAGNVSLRGEGVEGLTTRKGAWNTIHCKHRRLLLLKLLE